MPPRSDYQIFLHDKITALRENGLGWKWIADWLNENGYKTPRGKVFEGKHVHSIVKKKRISDERFNKKHEREIGKLSMKYIDRTLVNSK